jgi:hypothetical protein
MMFRLGGVSYIPQYRLCFTHTAGTGFGNVSGYYLTTICAQNGRSQGERKVEYYWNLERVRQGAARSIRGDRHVGARRNRIRLRGDDRTAKRRGCVTLDASPSLQWPEGYFTRIIFLVALNSSVERRYK